MSANAASRLLQHYVDNFRRLPWRAPPGAPPPDPYRVWLSEIMLQQTTVATVLPRFQRFLARWPTIADLARAPEAEVMQEWAGLGYYTRARNLIACAREVAANGGFPQDETGLRRLPGVGAYTAAAIAAIAFKQDTAPVDTNVERVVARLHGLADKGEIHAAARAMVPVGRAGDFAQAMMDLGATICRPKAPRCGQCPLAADCRALALGTPEAFPPPKVRKERPRKYGIARWIEREGHVWLVRRPAKGMLGGMAALPGCEWTEGRSNTAGIMCVRHGFTHFELELAIVPGGEAEGEGWWQALDSIEEAGLPTLYRKAVAAMLAERTAVAA